MKQKIVFLLATLLGLYGFVVMYERNEIGWWISGIVAFVLCGALYYSLLKRLQHKKEEDVAPSSAYTYAKMVEEYGEPEDSLLDINANVSSEFTNSIYFYDRAGLMVAGGQVVRYDRVQSMRFVNMANIYLPCNYVVELNTSEDLVSTLRLSVGTSEMWAQDVMRHIGEHLEKESVEGRKKEMA